MTQPPDPDSPPGLAVIMAILCALALLDLLAGYAR